MSETIWKYELEVGDYVTLEIPRGGRVLAVDNQHEELCLWVLVDPHQEKVTRHFRIVGTGHPISEKESSAIDYLGTAVMANGALIWHVFEYYPHQERGLN